MCTTISLPLRNLFMVGLLLLLLPATAQASAAKLQATYVQLENELEENDYGIPVYILSNGENNTMLGEIYGIIDHPFLTVHDSLATPKNWCDIVPLHLNIKACTYQHMDGICKLTFYTGRKFYEKADDVYQIGYDFSLTQDQQNYFHANLSGGSGPMGTKDYNIQVEAIPLNDSKTFIHFSYSYKYNFLTSIGMNTYLATIGVNKVGFSITGEDEDGQPIYTDGIRGIIERNSVRYYFAIQSYLDTLHVEQNKIFHTRINKWFDFTEEYPRQLREMDRNDYLKYKLLENKDQQRLQDIIKQYQNNIKKCVSST